ncbi:hypothetical protein [Cecembia calidifontis]|jgi:hypothetical protein|uniref:Uncharacterized protein n=1 Tax=Cecembia calidifontis TaxID=1187080 RepID=A0A4Q7PCU6_9BACT|nr:hypothetical protein [Cecembia calidifontis]RZS98045.1 hypothetical protein BC751_3677 [Cecembia calidifontis]
MKTLSENWITEGWIDFEYKKYVLLAYLQHVESQFKEVKLYPPLAELIQHYSKLKTFSENREQLKSSFPKMLQGPDFQEMKLKYKPLVFDDDLMQQLEEIVNYSLPQIKKAIEEGRGIYDFLEQEMSIEPVGLSPIYQKEGYALLSFEKSKDIYVYRYKVNLFQTSLDSFKGIMMQLVHKVRKSITQTFEQIKLDLIKTYKELPNPATYRINSPHVIPLHESFLPISKRLLLKTVD